MRADLEAGQGPVQEPYQIEHDLLFAAIRNDTPYNEAEFSAKAAMAGIMGRMAAESGREIKWSEALASNLELAPGLDKLTMSSPPPVVPDAQAGTRSPCRGTRRCCKHFRIVGTSLSWRASKDVELRVGACQKQIRRTEFGMVQFQARKVTSVVWNGLRAVPNRAERHGGRSLQNSAAKVLPGLNHAGI